MSRLLQCIPNFSEGRNSKVVEEIVSSISKVDGITVVDYSMDADHNRSVVTFLGGPDAVKEAIFEGASTALGKINMRKQKGVHPRIGAVDVVPIVPVYEITMAEAVNLSLEIGKGLAERLSLPVYFYERSAVLAVRENLADVRKLGYEGLVEHGLTGGFEPDVGPHEMHPTAGATVVGARGPLVAYNVNLATSDVSVARKIASGIRKDRNEGRGMPGVKAIGLYLASRDIAQVSTNICEPHKVSIYDVYSHIEREARKYGCEVLESELIGALRMDAIIEAVKCATKLGTLTERRVLDTWINRET